MDDIIISTDTSLRRTPPVHAGSGIRAGNREESGKAPGKETAHAENGTRNKVIDSAELVEKANKHVEAFSTKISFSYDPKRQQTTIFVTDKETGKLIRQIPQEEMLQLMEKMEEIAGIIFNGRA